MQQICYNSTYSLMLYGEGVNFEFKTKFQNFFVFEHTHR